MNKYTIRPDTPGIPEGSSFKVFSNGIKVATLTNEQVKEALREDLNEQESVRTLRDLLSKALRYIPKEGDSDMDLREAIEDALSAR